MINSKNLTSIEIVNGLKNSENRVVKYVYDLCYPLILSLVKKNNSINLDAKEILHEGIIILYENCCKNDFTLTCEVTTYLYSICRNIVYNKTKQQMLNVEIDDVYEYEEIDLFEENKLNNQEEMILGILNSMGQTCKRILELFYFQKMKMDAIARQVGYTNADNAKNQKYKCLKKLKVIVKKEYLNA